MSSSPVSPRRSFDASSTRSLPMKRKTRKKEETYKKDLPFMSEDEFSDLTMLVTGGSRFYTNRCILAYNSPVLREKLTENRPTEKGAKGPPGKKSSKPAASELDLSEHSYADMYYMMSFLDPRCDDEFTDEIAFPLLPIAEQYEMRKLKSACEKTLTSSFRDMRRNKKLGRIPTEETIKYLQAADKYDMPDLKKLCVDECVHTNNPFSNKQFASSDAVSEKCKVEILNRKYEMATMALIKERRERVTRENELAMSKNWKKV